MTSTSRNRLTSLQSLTLDSLKPGYVYEFTFKGLKGADGEELINTLLCYTCNRLRDGSAPSPQSPGTAPPKPLYLRATPAR